jgi:lipopolysaccharide transport system ATP-binding protein
MGTITVTNLGKAYKQYHTRWSRLAEWLVPFSKPRHQLKWVLQDINFKVNPGEAVGIIGINGAGKSTLLKMITGTTQPTTGNVNISGRIAALLELGMGFHPDFTGRQNVYMAGQLLGHTIEEITRLMPEIEAFAEIGDYFDQPVRIYSSGMQVRIAFAVATAHRPDILIVDEALAVGDVYFQQRCYQRINHYMASGTTLLFVTHAMGTVLELCSRAIYLHHGTVVYDGSPKEVVDLYQADLLLHLDQADLKPKVLASDHQQAVPTDEQVTFEIPVKSGGIGSLTTQVVTYSGVRLLDNLGKSINTLICEERACLEIRYRIHRDLEDPHVGFKIRNNFGVVIFETNTYCMGKTIGAIPSGSELITKFSFPVDIFPGDYTITIGMAHKGYSTATFEESLSYLHDVMMFTLLPNPAGITWAGIVNIHPEVKWESLNIGMQH